LTDVRLLIVIISGTLGLATPVLAQTEGRVSVGVTTSFIHTTDSKVGSMATFGPLIRLNPRKGWGPAVGLSWFRADLDAPTGGGGEFARLRVRHLMGGVAYSVGPERVLTSFSIVAGGSFNTVELLGPYAERPGESIEVKPSAAVRPGVGLTVTVAPRLAVIGFGGYLFNRPNVVYRNPAGQEFSGQWKADALIVSGGLVVSLF
jgi:hypothetical protein